MVDQTDADIHEDDGQGEEMDNAVIQTLRAQLKEAKAKADALAKQNTDALAEARSQLERESAAQQLVDSAGYPGLKDVVLEKVDGDLTPEAVEAVLEGLGLEPTQTATDDLANQLGKTASLGAQVAAAAQSNPIDDLGEKLGSAQNAGEIAAIMAEAGLLEE